MCIYTLKPKGILVFITAILVLITEISSVSAECTLHDKSQEQKDNLARISPLIGKELSVQPKASGPTYKIGICIKPSDDKIDSMVGAVEIKSNNTRSVIGLFNNTEVLAGSNWVMLNYYSGDNITNGHFCNGSQRMANILIVCDPNTEMNVLKVLSEQLDDKMHHCLDLFEFGSKYVCEVVEEKLSSGSVFCILFFTSLGLYLLIGFLYQRLVIGAQGMEQIPNFNFWKDFGNLQADGCDFVCRCGSRTQSTSYRGIDERLPRAEERDDQLLTM